MYRSDINIRIIYCYRLDLENWLVWLPRTWLEPFVKHLAQHWTFHSSIFIIIIIEHSPILFQLLFWCVIILIDIKIRKNFDIYSRIFRIDAYSMMCLFTRNFIALLRNQLRWMVFLCVQETMVDWSLRWPKMKWEQISTNWESKLTAGKPNQTKPI